MTDTEALKRLEAANKYWDVLRAEVVGNVINVELSLSSAWLDSEALRAAFPEMTDYESDISGGCDTCGYGSFATVTVYLKENS